MRSLWAVARHTFAQCLRMKIAAAFIILLGLGLAMMPVLLEGDGTLAGRIRTLLVYGLGMTALLLSLVTVFLSTAVITGDVRTRQIFSVVTKPISRWQYVIGRWLGVVLLDLVLLTVAAAIILAMANHFRDARSVDGETVTADDRRVVESEVFAARQRILPLPINIDAEVIERIRRLQADDRYEPGVQAFLVKTNGDRKLAEMELQKQLARDIIEQAQSAPPGDGLDWEFENIKLGPQPVVEAAGRVIAVLGNQTYRIRLDSQDLIGQLVQNGPVRIEDVEARAMPTSPTTIEVQFTVEAARNRTIAALAEGSTVRVAAEPSIQISYRVNPSSKDTNLQVTSLWYVLNPTTGEMYGERRDDAARLRSTLTVPARLVDTQGRLKLMYMNVPSPSQSGEPPSVTVSRSDVAVLFRVGDFLPNYLRGVALIGLQLVFLATVGIAAGSFLSFPVACLVTLVVLPFGMARGFLSGAIQTAESFNSVFQYPGNAAIWVMRLLMPDFGSTSGGSYLVNGMLISWSHLGETAVLTLVVRGLLLLGVACVIFHRRELARVQV